MTKEELYRELAKQKMEMTPDERMKAYMGGRRSGLYSTQTAVSG